MGKYICMRMMNTKFKIVVTGHIWDQREGGLLQIIYGASKVSIMIYFSAEKSCRIYYKMFKFDEVGW